MISMNHATLKITFSSHQLRAESVFNSLLEQVTDLAECVELATSRGAMLYRIAEQSAAMGNPESPDAEEVAELLELSTAHYEVAAKLLVADRRQRSHTHHSIPRRVAA